MSSPAARALPLPCTLLLLLLAAGGAWAQSPQQPQPPSLEQLLPRAAARAERLEAVYGQWGYSVTQRKEELDRKGRVDTTTERVSRWMLREGARVSELVRYVEQGKDATAQERERLAKRSSGTGSRSFALDSIRSPFLPEEQPRYRFSVLGPGPAAGQLRVRFEPRGEPSESALVGEAWLSISDGSVRRLSAHPSRNPRHVDRLDILLEYATETSEGWALSRATVEGKGGFLFIRKHFRSTLLFAQYAPLAGQG
jgi:hypothetical protein